MFGAEKLMGVFGTLLLLDPAAAFWGAATPSSLESSQVAQAVPLPSLAAFRFAKSCGLHSRMAPCELLA